MTIQSAYMFIIIQSTVQEETLEAPILSVHSCFKYIYWSFYGYLMKALDLNATYT